MKSLLAAATASAFVMSASTGAWAQVQYGGTQRSNSNSTQLTARLNAARSDFDQAAKILQGVLPIYNGYTTRAVNFAKEASLQVSQASLEVTNGTNGNNSQRSAQQPAPTQKNGANVPASHFNNAQLYASNTQVQQAMQLLQQGLQILRAIGNDRENHMRSAVQYGTLAGQNAYKGLDTVTGK